VYSYENDYFKPYEKQAYYVQSGKTLELAL